MSELNQKEDFKEVKIAEKTMPFWLKVTLQCFFFFVVIILFSVVAFQYIFPCPVVVQDSMHPTLYGIPLDHPLNDGRSPDSVYVNRFGKIKVGNIIVTNYEIAGQLQSKVIIKRVIAMEGDTFAMVLTSLPEEPSSYGIILQQKGEQQPKLLNETYLAEGTNMVEKQKQFSNLYKSNVSQQRWLVWGEGGERVQALIVPDNHIFFLGDNRDGNGPLGLQSSDCMYFGFQKTSLVRGRVDAIVYESKNKFLYALKLLFPVTNYKQRALLFPIY